MRCVIVAVSLLVCVCLTSVVQAQNTVPEDRIAGVIARAQTAIETGAASVEALNELRSDLDELRRQVSVIAESGSVEARTIEAQVKALGPPPGEGESEAEEIASRRAELAERLAEANRPAREAQERLNQVELLIRELDKLIRSKDTSKLIQRFPSILWPGTLAAARKELSNLSVETLGEVRQSLETNTFRESKEGRIVLSLGLALAGLALVLFVRPKLSRRFDQRFEEAGSARRYLWALLSNLSSLLVPSIGAVALAAIVPVLGIRSQFTNYTGQYVLEILLVMIVANWLGQTVFSPHAQHRRLVRMDDRRALLGLRLCQGLGLVEAFELLVEALALELIREQATISVIAVPILAAVSLLLWKLAALLNGALAGDAAEASLSSDGKERTETNRGLVKLLIFLLRATAIVTVPLVLAGYVPMARHLSDAMVMTVALLGFALFLYVLITGCIHSFVNRGRREQEDEATLPLLPFIIGSLLALAMMPALAIFWGARTADVAEAWRLVTVGVQVGDVQLSLGVVVSLLVVFFLGTVATRWLQHGLRETVLPRTRLDPGARNALVTGIGYAGLTLSALIAVSAAGLSLSSLAVVAGALSLGIGFGMQTIVSNFVSGIILLIERPIAEGDWIEVSGHSGIVKKIAVRSTQISTFDKHDVIVPNQDLIGGTVKNMTLSSRMGRLIIPVGVAYGSDLEKTKAILEQAAREEPSLLGYPAPAVLFRGLGESALDFELRCYLKDVDTMATTQSDLLFRIYVDLSAAGIEIPFPQRDVNLRQVSTAAAQPKEDPDRDPDLTVAAT
ncbi:mechanosensitive ion channel domain-containing protein [Leisingera thetidis]|uniref:mechanosensitive ion channel domain-containing protein n=1 Tax=Leisingera thetidis TaxID=2930199 RepID=UPI0021F78C92|nr:mechanosensitive ion channel domain-containing protein [Leisingera thetidis]